MDSNTCLCIPPAIPSIELVKDAFSSSVKNSPWRIIHRPRKGWVTKQESLRQPPPRGSPHKRGAFPQGHPQNFGASPQGYTTVYAQPLPSTTSSRTGGFSVLPSPAISTVPMGLWSNSSSLHGQILTATFHPSSPIINPTPPTNPGFNQFALTPTPGGAHQESTYGESDEEDEDEDGEDEFASISLSAPTNPPAGAISDSLGAHVTPARHLDQAFTQTGQFQEATNTVTSQSELNGADVLTGDDDDALESLRNKTKRRRQPHTHLGNAGAPDSEQAPLDRLDADLTNLNAYNEHERPFLHLARVVYSALLVTREAMPLPGTALKFQIEAYEEAGRLLKQGRPPPLPLKPDSRHLRLIAKHGPTTRGRLKTAALNTIDGRAEPEVVAMWVGRLLDRKNFTFRECTEEGQRAGIFRHPAIANVLISTLFRDRDSDGVLVKHWFLPLIPEEAIFMACIAASYMARSHKAERRARGSLCLADLRDYNKPDSCHLDGLAPIPGAAASKTSAEPESFFDEQDGD
ncbi:hypothetical protein M407DRAFT_7194 [Tulasnella calospora MUT 4182]|uniref:DUF6532 domain-containing protein n=1 Tax=Tulasnella calospora MUT 4182 TaxID=1051891 RepID=A0A0C3M1K3_9AGAM|nr:hypothetical protein M407DRAFT_7194 [Tulasnella calospora MUT 4182]